MNTNREMDQIVEDWLEDRVAEPQPEGLNQAIEQLAATSQARRGSVSRWFERGGLAHAPRGRRGLFGVASIVATLAALTLVVNVTTPRPPQAPSSGTGATRVVATDGSGDVSTITDAVAAAADGDTILIQPGVYTEAIAVAKDLTVMGDGPRENIIIEAPTNGPLVDPRYPYIDEAAYAVLFQDAAVALSGITFRGDFARVFVDGGTAVLEDLTFDSVSESSEPNWSGGPARVGAVVITGGSNATIRGNSFTRGGNLDVFERSDALIVANTFTDGPGIVGEFGDDSVIRDNQISGAFDSAIVTDRPTALLVQGNTITVAGRNGIDILLGRAPNVDTDPIIRDNTIVDSVGTGINLNAGTDPVIEGNVISGNRLGINILRTDPLVTRNELTGNATGIMVTVGAPTLRDNSIVGGGVGLVLSGAGTAPVLVGNEICGNELDLRVLGEGIDPDRSADLDCEAVR